jgi:hypothetical protein
MVGGGDGGGSDTTPIVSHSARWPPVIPVNTFGLSSARPSFPNQRRSLVNMRVKLSTDMCSSTSSDTTRSTDASGSSRSAASQNSMRPCRSLRLSLPEVSVKARLNERSNRR